MTVSFRSPVPPSASSCAVLCGSFFSSASSASISCFCCCPSAPRAHTGANDSPHLGVRLPAMPGANALEELEKLLLLLLGEIADRDLVGLAHLFVQLLEHRETTLGDVTKHLA